MARFKPTVIVMGETHFTAGGDSYWERVWDCERCGAERREFSIPIHVCLPDASSAAPLSHWTLL